MIPGVEKKSKTIPGEECTPCQQNVVLLPGEVDRLSTDLQREGIVKLHYFQKLLNLNGSMGREDCIKYSLKWTIHWPLTFNDCYDEFTNVLNGHFVNVGPRLAHRLKLNRAMIDDPLCHLNNPTEETVFQFKQLNERTFLKYIQNLKQGKSAGPDKIPTAILKDAAEFLCKPITMIFNSYLRLRTFPDRWKIARITPIYKSGAKDDTNNYRPISIMLVLSKLFEKIAHDQLIDFLQSNKNLMQNQFAFRKLHSTITSLIGVSDHWYSNIDNKKANFVLFLDLKKAFDTVDHEILIRSRGGGFFHSKGTWGCAAHKGILFRTSSLAKGILFGNSSRV